MVTVFDVAAYVIKEKGVVTTWKLQKLLYYCQAWSLVWDEKPLFDEDFEAWANGPVCRELYNEHQNVFELNELSLGNPEVLDDNQKNVIQTVLKGYGDRPPQWLGDLIRLEGPWNDARRGLSPSERGSSIISKESLQIYYGSLTEADELLLEEEPT